MKRSAIFVLGRPGSGKSTVSRLVCSELYRQGFPHSLSILSDYRILYRWSRSAERTAAFDRTPSDSFRVTNKEVLDDALKALAAQALARPQVMPIVEFARASYVEAFANFPRGFVHNSLIVYVNASPDLCRLRNTAQESARITYDSGFVPDDVMRGYYLNDDLPALQRRSGGCIEISNETESGKDMLTQVREAVIPLVVGQD